MPTVTDLDRALTDAGIPVDGASLIAALTEVCSTRRAEPSADGPVLTGAEAAVLAGHSGVKPDEAAPGRARSRAAAMTVAMYADALTTAQVATRLKVSTSWVRRLARDRRLYTLPRGRRSGLRFPRWQFDGDGPIPGMSDVLGALPLDVHPLEVAGFFTNATIGFSIDGDTPSTPQQWLRAGRSPDPVVDLASGVGATG